ncbi:MAG: flagellar basal-body rod protein FlgF [Cellulosilyticaceae bacterium]
MMRALWTAASGMTSQQMNVDTISNNLSNVNTAGYKKETVSFKSLLYQKMDEPNVPGVQRPSALQVGHGVRVGATSKMHTQGILQQTGTSTDLAIQGKGFFSVLDGENVAYTRDGNFRFSMVDQETYALVTTDGHPVLSTEGEPIVVDTTVPIDHLIIGQDGAIFYTEADTGVRIDLAQLAVVQFSNVEGLEALGSNLYRETPASGEARLEVEDDTIVRSTIKSGYLEGSNVQVADEMVNLIVAQRAYELNSTAIKTVDTMLQQANELKRV